MKRVIFTTVQDNLEARKMLELALKSFYAFNSGFDFKVYCLDNSKESFEEYFDKFEFENLEFINFKDGTKWNNYLEHIKNDELTDLERKNMFISDPKAYSFDTTVCISKLEIVDLLLEKYDLVIASDIDLVFVDSLERSLEAFLNSGKFLGAIDELNESDLSKKCKMSFCACFMYFNKDAKDRVFNLMDKALYSLKYEDLREIPSFNKIGYKNKKYCFAFFEQDLLDYFIKDYFRLNDFLITTSIKENNYINLFSKINYELVHFAGSDFKPFYKFKTVRELYSDAYYFLPLRFFYSNLFKIFDVKIDFSKYGWKITQGAVGIYKFYASEVQKIKKRILCFKQNNNYK